MNAGKKGEESIISKLANIDDRVIYAVLLMAMFIPLIYPIGLPLTIGVQPRRTFDYIESLDPSSIVGISYDVHPADAQDGQPAIDVVVRHLIRRPGIKLVVWSIDPLGPMMWENAIEWMAKENQVYGEKYVYLGYIPGEETAAAAIAANVWTAFGGKDAYGKPLSEIPMMQEIHSAEDFDLIVNSGSTLAYIWTYMRQWQETYGVTWIATGGQKFESTYVVFLPTGQIYSMISGSRNASEYTLLLKEPMKVISTMDAQSMGHLVIVAFMILGNIFYFIQNKVKGGT